MKNKKIFCAIDTKDIEQALKIGNQIKKYVGGIKLGLEFIYANGPEGVKKIKNELALQILLDLKIWDIENTVIKAIESLDGLPVEYLTIHIANGKKTLLRAQQKANGLSNF